MFALWLRCSVAFWLGGSWSLFDPFVVFHLPAVRAMSFSLGVMSKSKFVVFAMLLSVPVVVLSSVSTSQVIFPVGNRPPSAKGYPVSVSSYRSIPFPFLSAFFYSVSIQGLSGYQSMPAAMALSCK